MGLLDSINIKSILVYWKDEKIKSVFRYQKNKFIKISGTALVIYTIVSLNHEYLGWVLHLFNWIYLPISYILFILVTTSVQLKELVSAAKKKLKDQSTEINKYFDDV
jgi:hypothetical protein